MDVLRDTACATLGYDARAKVESREAMGSPRVRIKQRGDTTHSEKGREVEEGGSE